MFNYGAFMNTNVNKKEKTKDTIRTILTIFFVLYLILIIAVAALTIYRVQVMKKYEDCISLAQKDLDGEKYEAALKQLNIAINIDDSETNIYIMMADAYIGLGEEEKAIDILNQGVEKTNNDSTLLEYLDKIGSTNKPKSSTPTADNESADGTGEMDAYEYFDSQMKDLYASIEIEGMQLDDYVTAMRGQYGANDFKDWPVYEKEEGDITIESIYSSPDPSEPSSSWCAIFGKTDNNNMAKSFVGIGLNNTNYICMAVKDDAIKNFEQLKGALPWLSENRGLDLQGFAQAIGLDEMSPFCYDALQDSDDQIVYGDKIGEYTILVLKDSDANILYIYNGYHVFSYLDSDNASRFEVVNYGDANLEATLESLEENTDIIWNE